MQIIHRFAHRNVIASENPAAARDNTEILLVTLDVQNWPLDSQELYRLR